MLDASARQRVGGRVTAAGILFLALMLAAGHEHTARAEAAAAESFESLATRAADLVERAASMRADASRFRIDATLYREGLRQRLLQSGQSESAATRTLVTAMVRMSALLHAAAECKTGRYIVCPADLMARLQTQMSEIQGLLESDNSPGH